MRPDPAERAGYLRCFYLGRRPTLLGRIWAGVYAWWVGQGLRHSPLVCPLGLERQSGKLRAHVLAPLYHEGRRYPVSMLGAGSNWGQDVRASSGSAYLKRGRMHPVMLSEVAPEGRAPVLKARCRVATSGRRRFPVADGAPLSPFEAIAGDYPVFRVDPATS
jgi:hypothetical protein